MSSDMPTTFIAGGCGAHGKRGDFGPDLLTRLGSTRTEPHCEDIFSARSQRDWLRTVSISCGFLLETEREQVVNDN